ncbi:hypothetical protein ACFX1W_039608 [Malus domestica]
MKSALESNQPKKKGPYKRKAIKESNSNAYERNGPSTRYAQTQGHIGMPSQNQFNMAPISQVTHFPYGFPIVPCVQGIQNLPVQGIQNHQLGFQAISPMMSNYSFMNHGENIQPIPLGTTPQLKFSNPSTSNIQPIPLGTTPELNFSNPSTS